jgi:hypothetical protein
MSLPRSGSRLPSLNVGQDNCAHRLGQQPQSVPNITLGALEMAVNKGRAIRSPSMPASRDPIVDKVTDLRDAIANHLAGTDSECDALAAIRSFTTSERSRGERVERVVIALKQTWESLHDERHAWPRDAQLHLLDRLVTRCIDDYYAANPASDHVGGSRGFVR